MSALVSRDPLPGRPLVFRIDTRNGRDSIFWCKVRLAYLPRFKGHVFWACDSPHRTEDPTVVLPRPLLLQFQPEFVRLSPAEREHIRRHRSMSFVKDPAIMKRLRAAGLVRGRKITPKGLNSYYLSP